jgi:hypothetical protein
MTYWHLPDPKLRNQTIHLLDADNGRALKATLQFVANEQFPVGGKPMACSHYRLSGDVSVDLWFDNQERLIYQTGMDNGHPTTISLVAIRH